MRNTHTKSKGKGKMKPSSHHQLHASSAPPVALPLSLTPTACTHVLRVRVRGYRHQQLMGTSAQGVEGGGALAWHGRQEQNHVSFTRDPGPQSASLGVSNADSAMIPVERMRPVPVNAVVFGHCEAKPYWSGRPIGHKWVQHSARLPSAKPPTLLPHTARFQEWFPWLHCM